MHSQFNWPLIGHNHIKQYFEKAFAAGRVHHAYLFEGPSQVGKSTFAHLLVKTLLCGGERTKPCGSCRACEAFDHGAHPDILRLERGEEASIKIEPTRAFISALAQTPLLGERRIGIIEEAAQLVPQAANALLKTLEEPPARAIIFIISSAELLPTIVSRCQRIRFGFVTPSAISELLIRGGMAALSAEVIAKAAYGRPGRAIALAAPEEYERHLQSMDEMVKVFGSEEGGRIKWIAENFGGKGDLQKKRELCAQTLRLAQYILRDQMGKDIRKALMLRNTLGAEACLKANIDPQTVMEYALLDHGARNT